MIGSLRIHESSGEVHFHNDQQGTKVAVPSATMFDAWEKLSDGRRKKFRYVDRSNGTELRVEIIKVKRKKRASLTDAFFEVRRLKKGKVEILEETTPEFERFNSFIKG